MDIIRGSKSQGQFAQLLNESFGLKEGAEYLHDFPIWDERLFGGPSRVLRAGIWIGDQLVSCAGVRPKLESRANILHPL